LETDVAVTDVEVFTTVCSPFGGIPRNWKPIMLDLDLTSKLLAVPPSGGSLEIGNTWRAGGIRELALCSPFGGIPRNWKLVAGAIEIVEELRFPLRGDP